MMHQPAKNVTFAENLEEVHLFDDKEDVFKRSEDH